LLSRLTAKSISGTSISLRIVFIDERPTLFVELEFGIVAVARPVVSVAPYASTIYAPETILKNFNI
jgi:hypothetical protein